MERGVIQRIYSGGTINPTSLPDTCVLLSSEAGKLKKGDPSVGMNGTLCEVVHIEYDSFGNIFHLSDGTRTSIARKVIHVFPIKRQEMSGPCRYQKKGEDFEIFPCN